MRISGILEVTIKLSKELHLMPILRTDDCQPKYFLIGGFLFMTVTLPWIYDTYPKEMKMSSEITKALQEFPKTKDAEFRVLTIGHVLRATHLING